MDLIDHWAGEVRRLEAAVVEARQAALQSRARTAFFVFFTCQRDAAVAAQANLTPEDGLSFRVHEAPGPEEASIPCRRPCCNCGSQPPLLPSPPAAPDAAPQRAHLLDLAICSASPSRLDATVV